MSPNHTRLKLAEGKVAYGCFLRYPDAGLAEMLAIQGLDFVIFDGEHGPLTVPACEHLARATELHGVTPGVRVAENSAAPILRYLDAGAMVCHVPGVGSAADAVRAVRAVKFRPLGDRGLSGSRASGYGACAGYASYTAEANRETQVVVHVESVSGVESAADIAAVEGVDVLLFGPLDLSHDLGVPGQLDHPEVVAGGESIAAAAASSGKVLGVVPGDAVGARRWVEAGARYVLATVESLLAPGVKGFVEGSAG